MSVVGRLGGGVVGTHRGAEMVNIATRDVVGAKLDEETGVLVVHEHDRQPREAVDLLDEAPDLRNAVVDDVAGEFAVHDRSRCVKYGNGHGFSPNVRVPSWSATASWRAMK